MIPFRMAYLPSIFASFLCIRAVPAPSVKGRNRFFTTAAAKRMRGVFFPMCKTRARSMAGLASRAFGRIRRFHALCREKSAVPKMQKASARCKRLSAMFVLPLSACTMQAPKKELRLFKAQKQYAPFFGAIPFLLILFLVLRLIQGAAQPFHGRTRAPYRASRCIPARSQKPQRRCSCTGACRT